MDRKKLVVSYMSSHPSLIHEPAKLARVILRDNDEYSLKEIIKEIKDTLPELLDEEDNGGYKKLILSKKTIRTKVDNEFDGNASAAARAMGVPERSMRRWYHDPESKKGNDIQRFVITYGQNNTPVHIGFFKSVQNYLKANNAELIVYQGRYRNPTSIVEGFKAEGDVWDAKIRPYLLNTERKLNDRISIFPANTNPTAVTPLSGFDVVTDYSGVFPHPKYQLKTVATPSKTLPKILSTTGAITIPNYSQSKAGMKSVIHHIIGAVVVEIVDDKKFHIRQISADDDGSFYDIAGGECRKYSVDGVSKPTSIESLVMGDIHAPFHDKVAISSSQQQIEKFNPNHLFLHDIYDCYVINHHSRNDRFLNTAKDVYGISNVEKEVDSSVRLINELATTGSGNHKTHIISSNHDEALTRWLNEADIDKLGVNAAFFHYLSWKRHQSATPVLNGFKFADAYQFIAREKLSQLNPNLKSVSFAPRDTPLMIKDVDFGAHGDLGLNGSRGSALGFSKIGVKSVIGHAHCMTSNHMINTDKGWINISDVSVGDMVLSYNNGINEFVEVTEVFEFNYSGELITIGSKKVGSPFKQTITPNHNLFLKDSGYINVCEAIVTKSASEIPLTAAPINKDVDYDISDDDIRRVVAICADGSYWDNSLRFNLVKQRKIDRVNYLFGDAVRGWSKKDKRGASRAAISKHHEIKVGCEKYFDAGKDKHLPRLFCDNLSSRQMQVVLDELIFWDGTHNPKGNDRQWTSSKDGEIDIISSICNQLGYRTSARYAHPKVGSGIVSWSVNRDYPYVSATNYIGDRTDKWQVMTKSVENTMVYCLSNKNNNFWVKEVSSGNISLTGNSPAVVGGTYQVGVNSLMPLSYSKGASSWMHTNCIQYSNGKRTLINMIDGEYYL